MSIESRVIKLVSEHLKVSVHKLAKDSGLNDPKQWDSIAHVNLILAFELEFDVEFNFDELDKITTIDSIVDSLLNKGVS